MMMIGIAYCTVNSTKVDQLTVTGTNAETELLILVQLTHTHIMKRKRDKSEMVGNY